MRLGVRGRLFLVSVGLIAFVGITTGGVLEAGLRSWLSSRLQAEMEGYARMGASVIEGGAARADDELADRLGEATRTRVTLIRPDGVVVGDSHVETNRLPALDNHRDRPEVAAALEGAPRAVQRWSTTLDEAMLYVSAPWADGEGVVRVARPMAEVETVIERLRWLLGGAAVVGLLVAIFMSGLASHFMSRTLRGLRDQVREVTAQQGSTMAAPDSDELGIIAGSVQAMAEELDSMVRTVATERDRFGAVLESMTEAVLALDDQRRVVLFNRAAMSLFGLTRIPEGALLMEVVRLPALGELVAEAQEGQLGSGEITLMTRDGGERTLLVHATPQRASGGVVVVLHDVTKLRRLERMRRDFVANVSHELRTPVSVMQANAETLLAGAIRNDPDRAERFADAIVRNANRLTRLISDLLDISQIESGRLTIETEPINVTEAVEQATEAAMVAAGDKHIQLSVDVDSNAWVQADPDALDQVLLNLVENAVKYTPDGGKVRVAVEEGPSTLRILVEDNGLGIAPQHRPRVFERFYRVDPGRSREMGGTGLGLSIVKHLVQAMGGRVGVMENEPRGSVFWVQLARAADPDDPTMARAVPRAMS